MKYLYLKYLDLKYLFCRLDIGSIRETSVLYVTR